jgi:hypothetical protein
VTENRLDAIYVAASANDARFTRICVASIRRLYPQAPVRLLAGGPVEPGLAEELARYWDVAPAAVPVGDYGWGYVKLEPLFGPPGERFFVLDSDTVMAGPVLDAWSGEAPFLVDDEPQSEADVRRLYYDWERLRAINSAVVQPRFVFNSGQWFGTAGVLVRGDFDPWLAWSTPRHLRYPGHFMPGDQGVLNCVLNRLAVGGLEVARRKIMHWPGRGMGDVTAVAVAEGTGPPLVVHWAGMKRARLGDMVGADLLTFFEREYYARLPSGGLRRRAAAVRYILGASRKDLSVRVALTLRRLSAPRRRSPGEGDRFQA